MKKKDYDKMMGTIDRKIKLLESERDRQMFGSYPYRASAKATLEFKHLRELLRIDFWDREWNSESEKKSGLPQDTIDYLDNLDREDAWQNSSYVGNPEGEQSD